MVSGIDLRIVQGGFGRTWFPLIIGHEFSGHVSAVGALSCVMHAMDHGRSGCGHETYERAPTFLANSLICTRMSGCS